MKPYDAIVVGGGPAGLSAALVLGRARRRVLLIDDGQPRNAASSALHGFLSRDGMAPRELLRIAGEQLAAYDCVERLAERVLAARCLGSGFEVDLRDGRTLPARKLILATGAKDCLPEVEGMAERYGRGVLHCPYCDGWEVRDAPLAAYGCEDRSGGGLALELLCWSRDVVLCCDGRNGLSPEWRARLQRHGVVVRDEPIARLEGDDGRLERIVFRSGAALPRRAMFVAGTCEPASDLAVQLGCDPVGHDVDRRGKAPVSGLFVIGDASRDVLQIAVAAGEGSAAAIALNLQLIAEDFA